MTKQEMLDNYYDSYNTVQEWIKEAMIAGESEIFIGMPQTKRNYLRWMSEKNAKLLRKDGFEVTDDGREYHIKWL